MRILFVRSGNCGTDPISTNQGKSLRHEGVNVSYFDIIGKSYLGYLKNIYPLNQFIKRINPDLIHAHYSLCGMISSLSTRHCAVVTSLMGSDINDAGTLLKQAAIIFSRYLWNATIIKSDRLSVNLPQKKVNIIPNGVDLSMFRPVDRKLALKRLGWDDSVQHILFSADPNRREKNFQLAAKAILLLREKYKNIQIHFLKDIDPSDIYLHYNAASIFLLSSLSEGSPNSIKEAMACNCPIVSTDVGDVSWVLGETGGCYIASQDPLDYTQKISCALEFSAEHRRTKGRERIIALGLDSQNIACRLIQLYKNVLGHKV